MLLHKLIYRRHISRLLSPAGRRAGVAEAFNLSLSADSYTTPARPIRRPTLPHPSPPSPAAGAPVVPSVGVGESSIRRRR